MYHISEVTKEAMIVLFLSSFLLDEIVYMIKKRNQMIRYGINGSKFIELVTLFDDKNPLISAER